MKKRIVITGMSALTSLGADLDTIYRNIKSKKINLHKEIVPISDQEYPSYYLHKINNFDVRGFDLNRELLEESIDWAAGSLSDDVAYLTVLASKAIKDSNLDVSMKGTEVGLVATCEGPGLEDFFSRFIDEAYALNSKNNLRKEDFIKEIYSKCVRQGYNLQTFMPLFFVSKINRINGYTLFVNNACSSGLFALEAAANLIRTGVCSSVVVVGADHPSFYKYMWFDQMKLYAKDGKIKPFCSDANGYVFGAGGGGMVLESLEVAKKRGSKIYGEYISADFCSQSWKVTLPTILNDNYSKIMFNALVRAGLKKDDVDLIVSHGVGVKITDKYEANSINRVFGNSLADVLAIKPYVGHNLGGSGILESVISLKFLEENFVPEVLNIDFIDDKLKINIPKKSYFRKIDNIMKISTGFAGYEAAIILKRYI